jgi:hypothetical protein
MSRPAAGADYSHGVSETRCTGCGALVPTISGTVHTYVPSAPGCWQVFGEVQADEALRFGYPPAHRLVVDAYMAQHPGDGHDRRDRQSVFVHLLALCALLERAMPPDSVTRSLGRWVASRSNFPILRRGSEPGQVTVLAMVGAIDLDDYDRRARKWAASVWDAWAQHHPLIRTALDDAEGPNRPSPR